MLKLDDFLRSEEDDFRKRRTQVEEKEKAMEQASLNISTATELAWKDLTAAIKSQSKDRQFADKPFTHLTGNSIMLDYLALTLLISYANGKQFRQYVAKISKPLDIELFLCPLTPILKDGTISWTTCLENAQQISSLEMADALIMELVKTYRSQTLGTN